MKKIKTTILILLALSTIVFAGDDIKKKGISKHTKNIFIKTLFSYDEFTDDIAQIVNKDYLPNKYPKSDAIAWLEYTDKFNDKIIKYYEQFLAKNSYEGSDIKKLLRCQNFIKKYFIVDSYLALLSKEYSTEEFTYGYYVITRINKTKISLTELDKIKLEATKLSESATSTMHGEYGYTLKIFLANQKFKNLLSTLDTFSKTLKNTKK